MRFIDLGTVSPEYSVCADRALFGSHRKGSEDIMAVYVRDRPAISLGRFRTIGDVNDTDISIVRRISGGGSIYSDPGQMTYSLIFTKERVSGSREDSFRTICGCLVRMFGYLGIEASYKPVNDIMVKGKKISGSAQCRSSDSIIQHGSIILKIDRNDVDRHLHSEKGSGCITSVEDALGYVPERPVILESLKAGFRDVFGEMKDDGLTDNENGTIRRLIEEEAWK